jgi:hypothetical protein
VTYLKKARESLNRASVETTRFMGAHLRSEARASGWPEKIVRNLHVRHSDGAFTIHGNPTHKTEILNLEYGTPDTQPTAAMRRFNNRQQEAEKFMLARTMQHMDGYL